MKSSNGKKFDTIVRQYKAMRKKYPDRHIDYCVQQKTLADVIEVAAKAIDDQNKIHSHQRRVGRVKLNFFAEMKANLWICTQRPKGLMDEEATPLNSRTCNLYTLCRLG